MSALQWQQDDPHKRVIQYKKQIRREQKSEQMRRRRTQLLQTWQQSTVQYQVQLIDIPHLALEMSVTPNPSWQGFFFDQLRKGLISSQEIKQDYEAWVTQDIIKRLTLTFHQQYLYLNLGPSAANLLANLIHITRQCHPLIQKRILQYQIIDRIIGICSNDHLHQSSFVEYMVLLGQICLSSHQNRAMVVNRGAGQLLVHLGKKLLLNYNSDLLFDYLGAVEGFMHTFKLAINLYKPPPVNLSVSIIPILTEAMHDPIPNMVKKALKLLSIVSDTTQNVVINSLYSTPGLFQSILSYMSNASLYMRECALDFFNFITYSAKNQIIESVVHLGLIEQIIACYKIKESQQKNKIKKAICILLSNIAQTSQELAVRVFESGAIEICLQCAHLSMHVTVRVEALCFFETLLRYKRFGIAEKIIQRTEIIQIFMNNLNEMYDCNREGTVAVLQCIRYLIESYNTYYNGNQNINKAVHVLENIFNCSAHLNTIYHKSKTRIITENVSCLIDILSQY